MRFGGLIAAIVFAAIAAIIVLRMSANEAPPPVAGPVTAPQSVQTTNIYVAAQPISVGTTITAEMLAIQPWPESLVLPGFMRADQAADKGAPEIVGKVARSAFQPQEPVISSKLANPNDPNFLAGALPSGMRVITIATNEIEGLAGFVFPGDHVDVILTHDVQDKNASYADVDQKEPVTETLLTNVKVLAVDQRASGTNATDKEGNLIVPRSVSLMVNPTDVQRVRLGQKVGTLTLSLRSLADKEAEDPLTLTDSHDISQAQGSGVGGLSSVTVIRGTSSKEMISPLLPQQAAQPLPPVK